MTAEPTRDFRAENSSLEEGVRSLETATLLQYVGFLCKHLEKGGKISHTYDYPFGRSYIKMATQSASIPKGCGANAINVIVPDGMEIQRVGDCDHGNSYNMAEGSVSGAWTPIYPDIAETMINMGWHFKKSEFGPNADEKAVNDLTNGHANFKCMSMEEVRRKFERH